MGISDSFVLNKWMVPACDSLHSPQHGNCYRCPCGNHADDDHSKAHKLPPLLCRLLILLIGDLVPLVRFKLLVDIELPDPDIDASFSFGVPLEY